MRHVVDYSELDRDLERDILSSSSRDGYKRMALVVNPAVGLITYRTEVRGEAAYSGHSLSDALEAYNNAT